jgi:hypothetical protein
MSAHVVFNGIAPAVKARLQTHWDEKLPRLQKLLSHYRFCWRIGPASASDLLLLSHKLTGYPPGINPDHGGMPCRSNHSRSAQYPS